MTLAIVRDSDQQSLTINPTFIAVLVFFLSYCYAFRFIGQVLGLMATIFHPEICFAIFRLTDLDQLCRFIAK